MAGIEIVRNRRRPKKMDADKTLEKTKAGADPEAGTEKQEPETGTAKQEPTGTDKPLTFDEMLANNKTYQAEFDRRVQKAIETREKNKAANGGTGDDKPAGTAEAEEVSKLKEALMGYKLKDSLTGALKAKGVADDKTPFIERLINKADVFDGDEVSGEALEKQIDDILKAFPYFKEDNEKNGKKQGAGFKVGGPGEDDITVTDSLREQVRKSFGLK